MLGRRTMAMAASDPSNVYSAEKFWEVRIRIKGFEVNICSSCESWQGADAGFGTNQSYPQINGQGA